MGIEGKVEELISPAITTLGYGVVRVKMVSGRRQTLQIMIDRQDGAPITVEDCETASRVISAVLDVEDPVPGEYNLEVSSPGIDRPLVKLADFERFKGYEIKLSTFEAVHNRKRFKGRLVDVVQGDRIILLAQTEGHDTETIEIPFIDIASAKLVLNDELLALASS